MDFLNIFGRFASHISVDAAAVVDCHYVIPHTIFVSGNKESYVPTFNNEYQGSVLGAGSREP